MFNLFGKKEEKIKIVDKIWIDETSKIRAGINYLQQTANAVVAVWFEETFSKVESSFQSANISIERIYHTRQLTHQIALNSSIVFLEHYPLPSKEEELFKKLQLQKAVIYSSLDEPILKQFGSEKIIGLMKQLGLKEDEAIEHALITSSIRNAQKKIADKVSFEQSAQSQADWMMKNLTA